MYLPPFFLSFPSGMSVRDTGWLLHIPWGFLFFFNDYLFIEFLFGPFKNILVHLSYDQFSHCCFSFSFLKSVIILYILVVLVIFRILYLWFWKLICLLHQLKLSPHGGFLKLYFFIMSLSLVGISSSMEVQCSVWLFF